MIESKGYGEIPSGLKITVKLQELAKRRENREVLPDDFDLLNWLNWSEGRALTQEDLAGRAVVLSIEEFRDIGILTVILNSGHECELDSDDFPDDDILIIYPSDLL
jgi:hypothetical protein